MMRGRRFFPPFTGGYGSHSGAQEPVNPCREVGGLVYEKEVDLDSLIIVHVSRGEAVSQRNPAPVPEPIFIETHLIGPRSRSGAITIGRPISPSTWFRNRSGKVRRNK